MYSFLAKSCSCFLSLFFSFFFVLVLLLLLLDSFAKTQTRQDMVDHFLVCFSFISFPFSYPRLPPLFHPSIPRPFLCLFLVLPNVSKGCSFSLFLFSSNGRTFMLKGKHTCERRDLIVREVLPSLHQLLSQANTGCRSLLDEEV